jgi:hypothetical protein
VSEQGWKSFLAAEGVGDWVVLHGGATAVFRVESLRSAVRLAEAVSQGYSPLDEDNAVDPLGQARFTTQMPLRAGSSPIVRATGSASPPGPTEGSRTPPVRSEQARDVPG